MRCNIRLGAQSLCGCGRWRISTLLGRRKGYTTRRRVRTRRARSSIGQHLSRCSRCRLASCRRFLLCHHLRYRRSRFSRHDSFFPAWWLHVTTSHRDELQLRCTRKLTLLLACWQAEGSILVEVHNLLAAHVDKQILLPVAINIAERQLDRRHRAISSKQVWTW